ncbi:MAG: Uncharacterized protein G01um10145_125 [Microgenomates group bacterium Gr01-1014_5]|nr:MAG: Uncharacterized protein G01um10145_125 [Microgenomates group bacterium Gr01-1014_5]
MISRHARIQDKKATRSGVLLLFLSLLLLGGLLVFGIPALAKFAGLVVNLQGSQPIESEDKNTPAPPVFYTTVPSSVKEEILKLEGMAEGGSTVFVYLNDEKVKEFVVPNSGNFDVKLTLAEGENLIWAVTRDLAENKSGESGRIKVSYDSQAPILEITEPADATAFSGSEKSITVRGITEKGARVTVNDRLAIVSPEGAFSQKVTLTEGENIILVTVVDEGENETEKTLKVIYQP